MSLTRRTLLAASASALPLVRPRAQGMETFRIGVLTDLSGQYRDNSGPTTVLAAHQAVEDFNPEQHGFKVEILSADHQQKPDVGAGIARQWIDQDKVDCFLDLNNTAIALAVNTVAKARDKAMLITGAASGDLTGKYCSANAVHSAPDTFGNSNSTCSAILAAGGTSWYLIAADYTFGHALANDTRRVVEASGGKVLGEVAYPFPGTTDFSSFLLQAQASGTKVVGFANTGGDMENCVKQSREFGLTARGIMIAAMFGFVTEVKSMGPETAEGLLVSETFYWDLNDRTRAFTKRFLPKTPNNYPSSLHAAAYSTLTHYLKQVAALGPEKARSGTAAIAAMKAMPTDDDCFGHASFRIDGRFMSPVYLFRCKGAKDQKSPWDTYTVAATTPPEKAYRPLSAHACPLIPA